MKKFVYAVVAIFAIAAVGFGSADAAGLINGSHIKNHTISINKLTYAAQITLHSAKPLPGLPGANGTNGTNGTNGNKGADGSNGSNGADGTNGSDGANGSNGANGVNGSNGVNAFNTVVTHSSGPDSSVCGGNWANDDYTRTLQIVPQDDGSINVIRLYDGHFVTLAGVPEPSPAACPGTLQTGGVHGTLTGFDVVKITGGNYNPDGSCADPCTTAAMVAAFFPGGTATVDHGWEYHYHTVTHGDWTNADPSRGGNVGNIVG